MEQTILTSSGKDFYQEYSRWLKTTSETQGESMYLLPLEKRLKLGLQVTREELKDFSKTGFSKLMIETLSPKGHLNTEYAIYLLKKSPYTLKDILSEIIESIVFMYQLDALYLSQSEELRESALLLFLDILDDIVANRIDMDIALVLDSEEYQILRDAEKALQVNYSEVVDMIDTLRVKSTSNTKGGINLQRDFENIYSAKEFLNTGQYSSTLLENHKVVFLSLSDTLIKEMREYDIPVFSIANKPPQESILKNWGWHIQDLIDSADKVVLLTDNWRGLKVRQFTKEEVEKIEIALVSTDDFTYMAGSPLSPNTPDVKRFQTTYHLLFS